MLEFLAPSFLYNLGKDGFKLLFRRGRRLTPEQKIELRQKWKPILEGEIAKNWAEKLQSDIIIRDVRRVDQYPDVNEHSREISPWFRAGLVDTYHRGIIVIFYWDRLVPMGNGKWREKDHGEADGDSELVAPAGKIPFENIEAVDLDGDEYYNRAQVYCHFGIQKALYESIGYYTQFQNPGGRPHYTVLANVKEVQRRKWKRPWYRRLW